MWTLLFITCKLFCLFWGIHSFRIVGSLSDVPYFTPKTDHIYSFVCTFYSLECYLLDHPLQLRQKARLPGVILDHSHLEPSLQWLNVIRMVLLSFMWLSFTQNLMVNRFLPLGESTLERSNLVSLRSNLFVCSFGNDHKQTLH